MKGVELNMKEVYAEPSVRPLRASWNRETFGDLDINLKDYSIESVFRAVKRVGKIKELYGIGD